jgi:hypothetical protein
LADDTLTGQNPQDKTEILPRHEAPPPQGPTTKSHAAWASAFLVTLCGEVDD